MAAAPWIIAEYWLAQLTFVLIYAIVGLGLMLLAGFTGQFSMGHAAFLGVGAYTQAYLTRFEAELKKSADSAALIGAMKSAYPQAGLGIALDIGAKVNKGEMKW